MKKYFVFGSLLLIILLIGCNNESIEEEGHHGDTGNQNSIYPGDVLDKIKNNEDFKLIDTRSKKDYLEGYIKGAVLLPLNEISIKKMNSLGISKEDSIVVYGKSGNAGEKAYNIFLALGFANIKYIDGGITHWVEDNHPVLKSNSIEIETAKIKSSQEMAYLPITEYDFGKISREDGIVSKNFTIENIGLELLEVTSLSGSCGCTTAKIDNDKIEPSGSAIITVFFDPNFHKEPMGKFYRTIFVETNDLNNLEMEIVINIEILEE